MAEFSKISLPVLLLILCALDRPAWTQPAPGSAPPDSDVCVRDKKCRGMVESARRMSQSGQYEAALVSYQTAYANWPSTWLLLNIGRMQDKLARPKQAIETYRRVLKDPKVQDDPELQSKAQGYLREAEAHEGPNSQKTPESSASPSETKPIYKKWWFWTAIGGAAVVVVAVGVAVGVGVGRNSGPQLPEGAPIIRF